MSRSQSGEASQRRPGDPSRPSLLCIGPISIDHLVFEADGAELWYPSGNGVITSSILAEMGIAATLGGQVGADSNGHLIRKQLQSHGVDVSELHSTHAFPTKVGTNIVSLHGDWRREFAEPAIVPYLSETPPLERLGRFTHLHAGGLNGLIRSAPAATYGLIESSRDWGLTASVGLSRRNFNVDLFNRLISTKDVLFCTADEFQQLAQTESQPAQHILSLVIASRWENCLITLGSLGAIAKWHNTECYYVSADGRLVVEAQILAEAQIASLRECMEDPVFRTSATPISTVGAGDVFAGVFLAAWLSGYSTPDGLRAGARAASMSVEDATWDAWIRRAPDIPSLLRLTEGGAS